MKFGRRFAVFHSAPREPSLPVKSEDRFKVLGRMQENHDFEHVNGFLCVSHNLYARRSSSTFLFGNQDSEFGRQRFCFAHHVLLLDLVFEKRKWEAATFLVAALDTTSTADSFLDVSSILFWFSVRPRATGGERRVERGKGKQSSVFLDPSEGFLKNRQLLTRSQPPTSISSRELLRGFSELDPILFLIWPYSFRDHGQNWRDIFIVAVQIVYPKSLMHAELCEWLLVHVRSSICWAGSSQEREAV